MVLCKKVGHTTYSGKPQSPAAFSRFLARAHAMHAILTSETRGSDILARMHEVQTMKLTEYHWRISFVLNKRLILRIRGQILCTHSSGWWLAKTIRCSDSIAFNKCALNHRSESHQNINPARFRVHATLCYFRRRKMTMIEHNRPRCRCSVGSLIISHL